MLLVIALIPLLVVRAHMFQLRNSSYRQIRFGFEPNYKGAFAAYYGGVLVSVLTLGLGTPHAMFLRHRFAIDNSRFGRTPFRFDGESGGFFRIVYSAAGLAIAGMLAALLATMPLSRMLRDLAASGPESTGFLVAQLINSLPVLLVYGAIGVYTIVRIRNYVWMHMMLDRNTFISTLSVRDMCWLYLSNIVAIVCTVGLAVPWAQIRLARYRASCTEVVLNRDWKDFVAAERQQASALGEEIGEAFDVGVDLAI